jgi:hypothetical protein
MGVLNLSTSAAAVLFLIGSGTANAGETIKDAGVIRLRE